VAGLLGALVVGFVLYLLLITGPLQARSQSHLINQFRSELQTQQTTTLLGDPKTNTPPADGSPVALISIPQLGMTQVAVQGISSADTKLGPGHYPSSVLPGQAGNAVIVCRRLTFGAPCANLGGLAVGDQITAVTAQGRFTYEVTQIANNVALGSPKPTVQTKNSVLTLISAAASFNPDKEWVVAAKLLGTKGFQSAISLPLPAADVQPGKSTLTGAWGPILLWGELLLTAIVITWVLYRRRFAPAVTYLLTTPPLIALAYLFYGALAMLLPPSL
jgi:sortase A